MIRWRKFCLTSMGGWTVWCTSTRQGQSWRPPWRRSVVLPTFRREIEVITCVSTYRTGGQGWTTGSWTIRRRCIAWRSIIARRWLTSIHQPRGRQGGPLWPPRLWRQTTRTAWRTWGRRAD